MKFSNVVSVLAIAVASSSAFAIVVSPRDLQSPFAASVPYPGKPIPGDSPIVLCPEATNELVEIKKITISPNPPIAGQKLHVEVEADVKERIDDGAYIDVEVKLGYIRLIKKTFDFCENVEKIDMKCPIEKGPLTVSRDEDLPKEIPPGKFLVTAHLFTADDEQVTCLHAEVSFQH